MSRAAFAFALAAVITAAPARAAAQTPPEPTTIFLVRHAERAADDPQDPGLTPAGRERAQLLARILADAGLTAVYSTPFRRTMDTARPVARAAGLDIRTYDPRDPAAMRAFADELRASTGRILVTGHSNTTPDLVEKLGGDPGSPIAESDYYDRLYLVTITSDGAVSSILLHYGPIAGG